MTSIVLETNAAATSVGASPATEALEAFMAHQYQLPQIETEKAPPQLTTTKTTSSSPPSSPRSRGLKRIRSAVISPFTSGSDLEIVAAPVERPKSASDALDLSDLVRAAAPVEESVAFPSIEWDADGSNDDESDVGSDGGTDFACGFFSRSLDRGLSRRGLGSDSDDEDDDDDDNLACRAPPRKRRSGSSLCSSFAMAIHAEEVRCQEGNVGGMRRSKSRTTELDALTAAAAAAAGRDEDLCDLKTGPIGGSAAAVLSPGVSLGADPAAGGAATSLLDSLLGEAAPALSLPPSLAAPMPATSLLTQWGRQFGQDELRRGGDGGDLLPFPQ